MALTPWGSIIGGALQLGSTIYGGIKASQAMKEYRNNIANQQKDNQSWYDRRYNEDATQRADAQRMLELTRQNIAQRNRAAAGSAAVTGATNEAVAAQKAAGNQALADTASQIAASGARRQDAIEQQYRATDSALNDKMAAMEAQKAQNIASAVKGMGAAASSLGTSVDDWYAERDKERRAAELAAKNGGTV